MAAGPLARKQLRREAMAVAALAHPYICKIFEIGEERDELLHFVMSIAANPTSPIVVSASVQVTRFEVIRFAKTSPNPE
jgi:hypothetical protein